MGTINISEAKTSLSRLIVEVEENGKEFVIARAGKPAARLVPISTRNFPRVFSNEWKGKVHINEDFDTLPKEFLAHFS